MKNFYRIFALHNFSKDVSAQKQPVQQVADHRKDAVSFAHLFNRFGNNDIGFLWCEVDRAIYGDLVVTERTVTFPQSVLAHAQECFDNRAALQVSFRHHNARVVYPGSALTDCARKKTDEF